MAIYPARLIVPRAFPALIILLFPAVGLPAQDTDGRAPVPAEAAQRKALALAREIYGEELDKAKTSAQKLAVARKLLEQASQSKDDPASYFVLLRTAGDLAAEGGDALAAVQAVDQMAAAYDIDAVKAKAELLLIAAESASVAKQHNAVAEQSLLLVGAAVAEDDYTVAGRMGRVALVAARKAKDEALVKRVVARNAEVEEIARVFAAVKQAFAALEEEPADPESNQKVGEFLCLVKGDWEKGLPMLALGSDATLKALALMELRGTTSHADQVKLGDGWWARSEQVEGAHRKRFRLRAAYWYRKAAPGLAGLLKARVEKRIAELEATKATQTPQRPLPGDLVILEAVYGSKGKLVDVTAILQEAVAKDPFAPIQPDDRAFGDPAPGEGKRLFLAYRVGRRRMAMQLSQSTVAIVPPVPPGGVKLREASREFAVIAARYGAGLTWLDVTSIVGNLAIDPRRPFRCGNREIGRDPWFGASKVLVVWYDYQGRRYARVFKEGQLCVLLP